MSIKKMNMKKSLRRGALALCLTMLSVPAAHAAQETPNAEEQGDGFDWGLLGLLGLAGLAGLAGRNNRDRDTKTVVDGTRNRR